MHLPDIMRAVVRCGALPAVFLVEVRNRVERRDPLTLRVFVELGDIAVVSELRSCARSVACELAACASDRLPPHAGDRRNLTVVHCL